MGEGTVAASRPGGVAVDFGGTKIAAARITGGRVGPAVLARTDGDAGVEGQIAAIEGLLKDLHLQPDERLGVAVTGRVNRDGEWFAVNTSTLTGVDRVPLRSLLSKRFARPVVVRNDATAAAIGEYVAGAGRGVASMAYVTVSTGVGGGLVLEGRPLMSESGLAGHVGFTTSRIATQRCGSGRLQTVESVASGRAIASFAAAAGHGGMDARAVYEAHLAGAAWATALVRQSASAVAELCVNLQVVLDLDVIALGGSIGFADGYLDLVREAVATEPPGFRPRLVSAELGQSSALIGVLADL